MGELELTRWLPHPILFNFYGKQAGGQKVVGEVQVYLVRCFLCEHEYAVVFLSSNKEGWATDLRTS